MFVSYPLANTLQLPACTFDVAQCLMLFFLVHLHRCFGYSLAGPAKNRSRCLEFPLQHRRLCCTGC
jgi:hypothetical protein